MGKAVAKICDGLAGCRGIEPLRRKMLKQRIDTEIAFGSRVSAGHPTYAFSHQCQNLFHAVYLLKEIQKCNSKITQLCQEGQPCG